ncbi:MAG: hypothetical protein HY093_00445 [Candidatus Liptonbacteria bacterium]|nr:hypothetical protein [Candidatus Liptonbacteria bacterium]
MNKQTIFIAIFLIILVGGVVTWFALSSKKSEAPAVPTAQNLNQPAPTAGSLGSEISEKVQNPIKDKLPSTAPVGGVNPLGGAYQNPFGR